MKQKPPDQTGLLYNIFIFLFTLQLLEWERDDDFTLQYSIYYICELVTKYLFDHERSNLQTFSNVLLRLINFKIFPFNAYLFFIRHYIIIIFVITY